MEVSGRPLPPWLSSCTAAPLLWGLTCDSFSASWLPAEGVLWGLLGTWVTGPPCLYEHITCMKSTQVFSLQRVWQSASPGASPKAPSQPSATSGCPGPLGHSPPQSSRSTASPPGSLSLPRAGNAPHSSLPVSPNPSLSHNGDGVGGSNPCL